MGWLFVASVLSSYLIRKSFVTVFRYSNQFHGKKYPLLQLLMNADVVLIFFNRKLKTVLFILVVIAITGYLYAFIDRNLTQYHNS